MNLSRLVSSVNAARAREDFLYRRSMEIQKGKLADSKIKFEFDGETFLTDLPYGLRITEGVAIEHLNSYCFLMKGNVPYKSVRFQLDALGNVSWS